MSLPESLPSLEHPIIAVDIGNSSIKFGCFESLNDSASKRLPEAKWVITSPTREDLSPQLITALPPRVAWHVVSVQRTGEQQLADWVNNYRRGDSYRVFTRKDLPIQVDVDFPDRVGVDRLAAAAAVNHLREASRAAVVVGAGSAMTIDLVTPEGVFAGGTILAGYRMCAEALARNTDLLPLALLEPTTEPPALPGKSTDAAIRAGLFWGAVGAVREIHSQYAAIYPHAQLFITGGDLERLALSLGNVATFVPNLVLAGIALASR